MRRIFSAGVFIVTTLILFLYVFGSQPLLAAKNPSKISFKAKDGTALKAYFAKPKGINPVVICLHGLASSKEEWLPLVHYLSQQGWGVLAYDARGHGESSKTRDSKGIPNGFQFFGNPGPGTEWDKMVSDIGAAAAYLRIDQKLDTQPLILCGASLGANVSLIYISLTRSMKSGVLLSPGINYVGFGTEEPVKQVQETPLLLVASKVDSAAMECSARLSKLNPKILVWTNVNPGHGVQMLDEPLMKRIFDWMSKTK